MVDIEQEEFDTIKAKADKYDELQAQHNTLLEQHNALKESNGKLKDDYIALCKGQQQGEREKSVDDFDKICQEKFGRR